MILTNLGIDDSIRLLFHYRTGTSYKESVILVDSNNYLIGFWDNLNAHFTVLKTETPFEGGFVIQNGIKSNTKKKVKCEPYVITTKLGALERQRMKNYNLSLLDNIIDKLCILKYKI